jgi:hypothetical protein
MAIAAGFFCPLFIMVGQYFRLAMLPSKLHGLLFSSFTAAPLGPGRSYPLLFLISFPVRLLAGPGRFTLHQKLFGG